MGSLTSSICDLQQFFVQKLEFSRNNHLNLFFSRKNENGNKEAGTHLIIVDDSTCDPSKEQLSDPKVLNYYRQFLIQGFDERYYMRCLSQITSCIMYNVINICILQSIDHLLKLIENWILKL